MNGKVITISMPLSSYVLTLFSRTWLILTWTPMTG